MNKITAIEDFYSYCHDHSYISFDLFDTLVRRRLLKVNEVHDTVSAYVLSLIGRRHHSSPLDLTHLRYRMSDSLKSFDGTGTQEPLIDEVWDRILTRYIPDQKKRSSIVKKSVQFETAIEISNLSLINGGKQLLNKLKSDGKTLIAVSDMYFDMATMRVILGRLGLLDMFDHIYVSADSRLTKQSGDLFRKVLNDLNLDTRQLLHVGDNYHSDIKMAAEAGVSSILVEQEHLLELERPNYGRRMRIEEEVADVVKVHLASMLLDAIDKKVDHLYFLARDGCAINEFLGCWNSSLVNDFLPPPPRSDMYMNRILSCWGGVDFSGDWLVQAIGLVFWLNHGEASAEQMCAHLGVKDVPPAFGTEILRSDSDTFRVAEILTEAGLKETVRAAILEKRAQILRNLRDIGFFDHRAVAFSDVGYSGTVMRDLNSLFVSLSGKTNISTPDIYLHLIATNNNYCNNKKDSYPFVKFSDQVVLPFSDIPESLLSSFSWLEYFFKHKTLKPILRFVEQEDGLRAELRHDSPGPDPTPAERVWEFAPARDEDIVLLWMAAVNFHGPLSGPVIERFNRPDAKTLAQMKDEIFELHSVQGTKRSIILEVPGGRPEAITLAARAGDFWLPGSLAASSITPHKHSQNIINKENINIKSKLRNILRKDRKISNLQDSHSVNHFDQKFYWNFYPDVRHLNFGQELTIHYFRHGRKEKRFGNYQALVAHLIAEYGQIPGDFDPHSYLALNPDVAGLMDTPERALDHYMRMGRKEGRPYRYVRRDVTHEFDVLLAQGAVVLSGQEIELRAKGFSVLDLFLRRHGARQGPWIDELNVAEFRALHFAWAGAVENKAECIVVLLEQGLPRLPALSLDNTFDVEFYRTQVAWQSKFSDTDMYRHYLEEGSLRGLASSEAAALKKLWGFGEFPEEFDWQGFAASIGLPTDKTDRIEILQRFIYTPGADRLKFISSDKAGRFVEFLAVRARRVYGRKDEAKAFFKAGLLMGHNDGAFHHHLGDLAMQQGKRAEALLHFRKAIETNSADRWSFIHAAELLIEQGDHASALTILGDSEEQWQQRAPWRRVFDNALRLRSRSILRDIVTHDLAPSDLSAADRLYHEIAAALPDPAAMASDGGVLLLTSHASSASGWDRTLAGVTIYDLDAIDRGEYLASLLTHETVILHDLPFTFDVLKAIALARSLKRRTVAWIGNLREWEGQKLGHCEWNEGGEDISPLRLEGFLSYMLPARYCDRVVTTLAGCVPVLDEITSVDVHYLKLPGERSPLDACLDSRKRRTVLVMPRLDAPSADVQCLAGSLRKAAEMDPTLHFLIDRRLSETADLREIAGRWDKLGEDVALTALADTIGICDVVVQASTNFSRSYAAWKEAQVLGTPVVGVRGSANGRDIQRQTGWSEDFEQTEISKTDEIAVEIVRAAKSTGVSSKLETVQLSGNDHDSSDIPITAIRRKRVLFANVFFAPQVIGGATRVLKDNIDYCLDHHKDDFDIAVFCADEQNECHGEWRVDSYRGIPVFRVATPQELNMDWRGANEAVGRRFAAVLRAYAPDLVHIHCLQRLGVVIAEACKELGIPYVITLHDAWWISDYPFLTNPDGRPVQVSKHFSDQMRLPDVAPEASLLRAQRLRRALAGAQERLAVSDSFAAIYRDCGIPCKVIENGCSRVIPAPRQAIRDARVHLCHIGGMEYHKGAYLIEATLRNHSYQNLHFTVVDLARGAGQDTHLVWGTTPVTITGKMSTQALSQFYARMHVLLAPSTWPESYGLVTREALAHGLWIIASDRGSMADPVRQGENGFVVQVESTEGLAAALEAVDSDPLKYRCSPASSPSLRLVDDQSAELISFYNSLGL